MEQELKSLHDNQVWDLPKDRKVVGSKWMFKTKQGADGAVKR